MLLRPILEESPSVLEIQKRKAYELQDALIDEFPHNDIVIDAVRLPADLAEEGIGVHLKFNSVPYWTKGTEFYLRGLISSFEMYRVLDDKSPREGRMEQLCSGFHIDSIARAIRFLCVEIIQAPSDFLTAFVIKHDVREFNDSIKALGASERIKLFKAVVAGKKVKVNKNAPGGSQAPEIDGYDIVFQSVTVSRTAVVYIEK